MKLIRTASRTTRGLVVAISFILAASLLGAGGCARRQQAAATSPEVDIESAQRLYDGGQFDAAAQVLERVVAEDPADLEARRRLGLVYGAQGRTDRAIQQYHAVVDASPRDHVTLFRLGLLERQAGRVPVAKALLERAVEVRPTEQSYLEELARTRMLSGDTAGALALYDRLLKRPELTQRRKVALLVERGQTLLAAGKVKDARRSFEDAARIDPSDLTVRRMLRRTK